MEPTLRQVSRARGHTLVELIFALAIVCVALAALMSSRLEPIILSRLGGANDAMASRALEQNLRHLVVELQEGTRLFHPPAGIAAQNSRGFDGLGFVDARGEVILYYLDPPIIPPGKTGKVMRLNVNAQRRAEKGALKVFLENVEHLYVNVAPAAPGKMPSLVDCDVAVQFPALPAARTVTQVFSVFLRNVETPNPDDIFVPGTPLDPTW